MKGKIAITRSSRIWDSKNTNESRHSSNSRIKK